VSLPVFADVTIGSSLDIAITVKDANGATVSNPAVTALAQKQGSGVPAAPLTITSGHAAFEPAEVGTYVVSIRVTAPVKAVHEGLVRVEASSIV
jgi:hypothetical protein